MQLLILFAVLHWYVLLGVAVGLYVTLPVLCFVLDFMADRRRVRAECERERTLDTPY